MAVLAVMDFPDGGAVLLVLHTHAPSDHTAADAQFPGRLPRIIITPDG
jgi:hypothetical protein